MLMIQASNYPEEAGSIKNTYQQDNQELNRRGGTQLIADEPTHDVEKIQDDDTDCCSGMRETYLNEEMV